MRTNFTNKLDRRTLAIVTMFATGIAAAGHIGIGADSVQSITFPQLPEALAFDPADFWTLFAALFAIMNPLIAVPLFVDVTKRKSVSYRKNVAFIASVAILIVLVVAMLMGEHILGFFAISMGAFRLSGGIIVLLMGLAMLKSEPAKSEDNLDPGSDPDNSAATGAATADGKSLAICPIAIPLLAGPGAIATLIVNTGPTAQVSDYAMIMCVIASIVAVTFATLCLAVPIALALGSTGIVVISRIIGMITAAIAMDMMITGLRSAFPALL